MVWGEPPRGTSERILLDNEISAAKGPDVEIEPDVSQVNKAEQSPLQRREANAGGGNMNEDEDLDLLDPNVFDKALAGAGKAGQGTGCTGASSSMDACHEKGEYAVMSSQKGIDQCVYCTWPKKNVLDLYLDI